MRRLKYGILLAVLCLVCGAIALRIDTVNRQAKRIPCTVYDFGEQVELGKSVLFGDSMEGYSIRILDSRLRTIEEFAEAYHCSKEDLPEWEYMSSIFEVEVEISNKDNETTGIDFFQWSLQNESAVVSFHDTYYRIANADKGYESTAIAVRPGTSVRLKAEFPVPKLNFKPRDYRRLWDLDFRLVVTLYPEKRMMRLWPSS